jgi:hypothetical protein
MFGFTLQLDAHTNINALGECERHLELWVICSGLPGSIDRRVWGVGLHEADSRGWRIH